MLPICELACRTISAAASGSVRSAWTASVTLTGRDPGENIGGRVRLGEMTDGYRGAGACEDAGDRRADPGGATSYQRGPPAQRLSHDSWFVLHGDGHAVPSA
jgi:hypothetical protein